MRIRTRGVYRKVKFGDGKMAVMQELWGYGLVGSLAKQTTRTDENKDQCLHCRSSLPSMEAPRSRPLTLLTPCSPCQCSRSPKGCADSENDPADARYAFVLQLSLSE